MLLLSITKNTKKVFNYTLSKMAYYKLIRMPKDGKAVRGRLFQATESRFEEVLIPICDTLENANYIIPALIYGIGVTQSPKFKRLLPIVRQVPGRSGIRFHRGTRPEHSKGCILVSPYMEQQITSRWLAEQSAHEETRLEICNYTNLNLKEEKNARTTAVEVE